MSRHGLEEGEGSRNVGGIIREGFPTTLPHGFEAGKVDHRVVSEGCRVLGFSGFGV